MSADWDSLEEADRNHYLLLAYAALLAMKDPTDKMLEAAAGKDRVSDADLWRIMIGECLK